jgi:exodeoxyribonuclease V gamma subunit
MLHLHFANRPETLTAMLLERLAGARSDPLAAEPVIVPNAAHRRRLALAIADTFGICANQPFGYLALWLWQQVARVVPQVGESSPFDTATLQWRIWRAFGDAAFVADQPRLRAYLRAADPRMRLELAQRCAALFDRYLTYRADWLQHWAAGRSAPELPAAAVDEGWQAALWRRLAAEVQMPARHPRQAFAETVARAGRRLVDAGVLPARVHLFAPPAIAPLHLQMLLPLADATELHLYAWNPCRAFWYEVVDPRRRLRRIAQGRPDTAEVGHRLLAGWGRQVQAQIAAWSAIDAVPVAEDEHFVAAPEPTLLGALQDSVLDLAEPAPGHCADRAGDGSIEVHVAHSLARELEVLHDRLLALFAADPGLRPGDILVATPDPEAAAPLIDAQFGTAPAARRIDVTIAGRRRAAANAPARALLALLDLAGSRVTATDLAAVLAEPLVAARFGLDGAALDALRGGLHGAGFRWAIDAAQVGAQGLPANASHTLRQALARLLLGHALPQPPDAPDEPYLGLLPAGGDGGGDGLALGALWAFTERLDALRDAASRPQPPAAWAVGLGRMLDDFVAEHPAAADDRRELQATIVELVRQMEAGGVTDPLPAAVLREALAAALDDPRHGGAPGGGVTFGSFATLRGLPCRVLCAIGMDDGAFPAQRRPDEFDLLAAAPRAGDRQPRDDDRAAWLERVLAPREQLLVSYTGRSITDDSVRPPSVLVAELLDWLAEACTPAGGDADARAAVRRGFVVEHPLQPFSTEAFRRDGDRRRRSFDAELAEAARAAAGALPPPERPAGVDPGAATGAEADGDGGGSAGGAAPTADDERRDDDDGGDDDGQAPADDALPPFFTGALPAPGPEWQAVTLDQLCRFFRNPCRALLRRRLRIDLPVAADALADDERLAPDGQARHRLAERLLPALLRGVDGEALTALARAGDEAPAGTIGELWLAVELTRLQAFAQRVRAETAGPPLPPRAVELSIEVDGRLWQLRANLAALRASGWAGFRYAEPGGKDRLDAWLHHLVLCAAAPAGVAPRSVWIGAPGGFALRRCTDPAAQLARLLALYARGLAEPLHFFPKAAWAYVDGDGSLDAARRVWTPGDMRRFAEGDDPAYRLALRGVDDPLDGEFEALARAVFEPLTAHVEDVAEARA